MSEQNPYEQLGVTENASFEEIQSAKSRLSEQYREDGKQLESIEAAYDSIIMERLKMRQEGKIKVPDRIRFPERTTEVKSPLPTVPINNSPPWIQNLMDTPSQGDLIWSAGIFLSLLVISGIIQGQNQDSVLSLLLAFGFFANIFLINRKENKFGRAFLITFVALIAGVGLGVAVTALLGTGMMFSGQQISCMVTFGLFWLSSSFLR